VRWKSSEILIMTLDDRGSQMLNVALALLVVSTLSVALRCYVRIFVLKTFRWEDWMSLLTLVREKSILDRHIAES
jgi:hypothetical protein